MAALSSPTDGAQGLSQDAVEQELQRLSVQVAPYRKLDIGQIADAQRLAGTEAAALMGDLEELKGKDGDQFAGRLPSDRHHLPVGRAVDAQIGPGIVPGGEEVGVLRHAGGERPPILAQFGECREVGDVFGDEGCHGASVADASARRETFKTLAADDDRQDLCAVLP